MHLSKHSDLSLRVMMYLAISDESTDPITIKDTAERCNVSRNHLMKVVHKLVQLGYIHSTQGRGGWISLAVPADSIIAGDIIRAMEPTLNIIDCDKPSCPLLPACLLKDALNKAANAFLETLDNYSIADLTQNKPKLLQLLKVV